MLGLTPNPQFMHNQRPAGLPRHAGQSPRFRGDDESEFPNWDLELPSDLELDAPGNEGHSGKASPHGSVKVSKTSLDDLSEDTLDLNAKTDAKNETGKTGHHKKAHADAARSKSKDPHQSTEADVLPTDEIAKNKSAQKASKTRHRGEDNDEPVSLEAPSDEQYAHYAAQQQLQKQLEWGKRFEPAGRAMDWMEEQVKWAGRRSAVIAQDLGESARGVAAHAVTNARKSAASQLRRLVDVLDVDSKPQRSVEFEMSDHATKKSVSKEP